MMKEIEIAGPVRVPAVDAVMVKMPAPITTDTPNTVRSHQVRSLRNRVDGSSVSSIDCSTDLTRQPKEPVAITGPFLVPPAGIYSVLFPRWGGVITTRS